MELYGGYGAQCSRATMIFCECARADCVRVCGAAIRTICAISHITIQRSLCSAIFATRSDWLNNVGVFHRFKKNIGMFSSAHSALTFLAWFYLLCVFFFYLERTSVACEFHATKNPMSCSVYWAAYAWAYTFRLWNGLFFFSFSFLVGWFVSYNPDNHWHRRDSIQ